MEKLKRGFIRKDGLVFWGTRKPDQQVWVTVEKLNQYRTNARKKKSQKRKENPELARAIDFAWCDKNRMHRRKYLRDYEQRKSSENPLWKARQRIRCLIRNSFKRKGFGKKSKTREILGCSFEDLKRHIENQFSPGMSWDNKPEWHIDHIVPLASSKTNADVVRLNHYTNLRPLWASENWAKGARPA